MSNVYQPDTGHFTPGDEGGLASIFRLGIRQKVMLILITVLLAALTGSGWIALEKEKKDVMAEIDRRGSDISRFVAKSLAFSVVGYDYHTVQLLLDEITSSADVDYAKVENAGGHLMGESGTAAVPSEGGMVMFSEPIILNGDKVGGLTLGLSTRATRERLQSQKYTLLTREGIIIMLIALGEFLALSYIIVRPVSLISKSLNNSVDENGRIVGRLPVLSNDEFGRLANQFNDLGAQLNDANQRLQSKIELADEQLRKTNEQLLRQSDELTRMNTELTRMSLTDALTGLYNRRYFEEQMETEVAMSLRHGDPNSLIIIDVDHFKKINDTYGHHAGDTVLKDIAGLLKSQLRKTDVLCRVGGEEFVALCKRAGRTEAMNLAEKLRRVVENTPFDARGQTINVTVSAGVATVPDPNNTRTADDFYHCADLALYTSKNSGRNRVTHHDDDVA